MTRESLARKFRPAGFEQPEDKRDYVKPRAELKEAFDKWVNGETYLKTYRRACELIRHIGEVSYKEANSLLVDFKPKKRGQEDDGLFVSACYNQSTEHVIVFDVDAPQINHIGYRLRKDRILINNGNVDGCFGVASFGTVINNGETGDWFAQESSGAVINNGDTGDYCAVHSSVLAINNGEAGDWFAEDSYGTVIATVKSKRYRYLKNAKRVLKPADCAKIPELKNYLDELRDLSKSIKDEESSREFMERYGIGGERIESKINKILRNGGFEI